MIADYIRSNGFVGVLDENNKSIGNSEAAEQKMNVVGSYASAVMNMSFKASQFFLLWLSYDLNMVHLMF